MRLTMAKKYFATVKVIKDGRITIPLEIIELAAIKEGDILKITIEVEKHFDDFSQ